MSQSFSNSQSQKSLDSRARRAARRVGLRAEKSRKGYCYNFQGGFQLIDQLRNCVVEGTNYDLTAEQVIDYCSSHH